MSYLNLKEYEPVENRIRAFWQKYPDGRLITDLQRVERADGRVEWICKSEAYTNQSDSRPQATGFATEIEGSSFINRSNASENCETSSIGRCLANLGFATKGKRPSREEMQKTLQDKTTQNKTAQDKTEQNKTSQNKTLPHNVLQNEKKPITESIWVKLLEELSRCDSFADLNRWGLAVANYSMPKEKRDELISIFTIKKDSLDYEKPKLSSVEG